MLWPPPHPFHWLRTTIALSKHGRSSATASSPCSPKGWSKSSKSPLTRATTMWAESMLDNYVGQMRRRVRIAESMDPIVGALLLPRYLCRANSRPSLPTAPPPRCGSPSWRKGWRDRGHRVGGCVCEGGDGVSVCVREKDTRCGTLDLMNRSPKPLEQYRIL